MSASRPSFSIDSQLAAGRKLAAADLRLLILSLLAGGAMHGYEIIAAIQTRSGGYYRPSPGTVYPALAYIKECGHATAGPISNRKVYRITQDGRSSIEGNRSRLIFLWDWLETGGRKLARIAAQMPASDTVAPSRAALDEAIRTRIGAAPEEQRRIARILDRAAAQILAEDAG
jgi:DNA-binding PadR family transcriptional regulator